MAFTKRPITRLGTLLLLSSEFFIFLFRAFLVSYGSPQVEGFSMLVILILAIGLGLPVLLVLSGAIFICVRRCSSREDELSLER